MIRALFAAFIGLLALSATTVAQPTEGRPAEPAPLQTTANKPNPPVLQRACTKCGFVGDIRLKFCGMCGRRMPDLIPVPKPAVSWPCTKCKAANPAANRYCGACGKAKSAVAPKPASKPIVTSGTILKSCVNCSLKQRIDPKRNTYCVQCGAVLSRASTTRLATKARTVPPKASTSSKPLYCVSCGTANLSTAANCRSCGTKIPRR